MRAVVMRVAKASVTVEGDTVGRIERGFMILLGVGRGDSDDKARWLARKCAGLRVFEDQEGLMNLGLDDVGGEALVVSQFTLCGDCDKGRRPSFASAAEPEEARRLYQVFVEALRSHGIRVKTGEFGAKMLVDISNDGPVTLILER